MTANLLITIILYMYMFQVLKARHRLWWFCHLHNYHRLWGVPKQTVSGKVLGLLWKANVLKLHFLFCCRPYCYCQANKPFYPSMDKTEKVPTVDICSLVPRPGIPGLSLSHSSRAMLKSWECPGTRL